MPEQPASLRMPSSSAAVLAAPSLLALIGYALAALRDDRPVLLAALALGWIAHGTAVLVDILGVGTGQTGARFGFAPALSITVWMVIAVYGIESRLLPMIGVRRSVATLGLATVALVWAFPGSARVHADYAWSPLHWILGFASYGLFGAAVLHAVLWRQADSRLRLKTGTPPGAGGASGGWSLGMPLLKLESLTFGFVIAGFVVLSATLLLGITFPTPWHWSHKTVLSVLSWLVFCMLLVGRHAFGWRGRTAIRWLYLGSGLLMLAYVGSRFVLEVLLHRPPANY
jgi:ABC-type uncharacterized transport system permease subunit